VTHDLSDIIPEITRVLLMRDGQILADGPKEAMLQPGSLSPLFGTEVKIERRDGYFHLW